MATALILSLVALTQAPDSAYDRWALRLGYGPGSTGVVQGMQAEGVGGGTFIPRVDLLAAATDRVRNHYSASRKSFTRYTILGGLSIVGAIATIAYYGSRDDDWSPAPGIGLPVATFAVGWAGHASATNGGDHLRRAIWLYNRRFARSPDERMSDCPYDRCAVRVSSGVWSTQLVRGASDEPIGPVNSQHELFGAAGDSARIHYEAFRDLQTDTRTAGWVGLGAYLGAAVLFAASRTKVARGVAFGLMFVGYAAGHGSVYASAAAETELEQAIWFYNGALP